MGFVGNPSLLPFLFASLRHVYIQKEGDPACRRYSVWVLQVADHLWPLTAAGIIKLSKRRMMVMKHM